VTGCCAVSRVRTAQRKSRLKSMDYHQTFKYLVKVCAGPASELLLMMGHEIFQVFVPLRQFVIV
jgi:hypothetical protein